MEGSVETADDAIDIDPDIISQLETLTEAARNEITSMVTPKHSSHLIATLTYLVQGSRRGKKTCGR
jgi:hypothetical protein